MENLLNLQTTNSFTKYGFGPVIVWPCIGKPSLLSIIREAVSPGRTISCELIFLANFSETNQSILNSIQNTLSVIPLLGLDSQSGKGIEGTHISISTKDVIETPIVPLDNPTVLTNYLNQSLYNQLHGLGCEPLHANNLYQDFFCGKSKSFRLLGELTLNAEVSNYLNNHPFVLFNLIQEIPGCPSRILPHSLCLSCKADWASISFIHVSDLHIAKRNDEMLGIISTKLAGSKSEKVANAVDHGVKVLRSFLGKKETDKEEYSEIPLEKRFHNPNNMLRRFIRYVNAEAAAGRLDFIVMTGDLIDFCVRGDTPSEIPDFDLQSTNWSRFLDIILNQSFEGRSNFPLQGIEPSQELLVPIFTVIGNHDYRAGHYSIGLTKLNKYFGLRLHEAIQYEDPNKSPGSIISTKLSLMAYYQYINPFEDFFIKFGSNTFIFLNSGWDAVAQPQYLLLGEPSLTGFTDQQLAYLTLLYRNIITPYPQGRILLFSHAPILNPIIKHAFRVAILRKTKQIPDFKVEDFKETRLRSMELDETRSDLDLDYHAGVISKNWAQTLALIDQQKAITFNGHTHQLREFRTQLATNNLASSNSINPIVTEDIKPETPYAIYWDDYSIQNLKQPNNLEKLLPLHFQTPSLGFANFNDKLPPGAFRTVVLKQSQIIQLNVAFLGK